MAEFKSQRTFKDKKTESGNDSTERSDDAIDEVRHITEERPRKYSRIVMSDIINYSTGTVRFGTTKRIFKFVLKHLLRTMAVRI